jgi:hypothetical protein
MERRKRMLRRKDVAYGRIMAPVLALAALASLPGCASMSQSAADKLSQMPAIGLASNAPDRPAAPPAYPAVHDMPPARMGTAVLSDIEQQKLEDDLVAARSQQQAASGTVIPARKKADPPGARVIPASSSRTIY